MTLTSVADTAAVIARAVGFDGKWPAVGGIRGNRVTISQILEIGTRVRGRDTSTSSCGEEPSGDVALLICSVARQFAVEKVRAEDLEAGELKTTWSLEAIHKAVSDDKAQALLKMVCIGTLLSSSKGAWDSSDEMNQLFPEYKFMSIEEFLSRAWKGRS